MNVDTQFQPLNTAAVSPDRPVHAPPGQIINRPVERSHHAEPANNQLRQNTAQTESGKKPEHPEQQNRTLRQESELSQEEKRELDKLKARDREVRAHEAAHKNAAGNLARGSAQFTFETGPDGRRYAVGGEVDIDTSKVEGDPEATLRKAQTIRRAANAPAQPSAQDRGVAAEAGRMETEARREITADRAESSSATNNRADTARSTYHSNDSTAAPPGSLLDVNA